MGVSFQLSPVNFPSESSPLPSPGIELTLFLGMSLDLTNAFIHCAMCPCDKRCDKPGDKDEDNSPKNVNNVHNTSSQKYRHI